MPAFTLTTAQRNELQALRNGFVNTDNGSYSQRADYATLYDKVLEYVYAHLVDKAGVDAANDNHNSHAKLAILKVA